MAFSQAQLRVLLALVFLSGASGLVYQVVWHRYLAILLGAQARATAIVLALFLGGISVGYAVFGRWCRWKSWNLFRTYAYVEIGLALWALAFPFLFQLAMPMTAHLYGWLGVNSLLIDFLVAGILVLPPTFLMGGTLPLLTQATSRDVREASETHAKIYGVNTLGACLGCLLAGYILVPTTTLSWANWIAAAGNLIVGVASYWLFARNGKANVPDTQGSRSWREYLRPTREQAAILSMGFLSGFVLITLETIFVRVMGLSTGASNYNFTLVVAIFIFGLGIGPLVVRKIADAGPRRLFWNQIAAAGTLCLLFYTANSWSYCVHVLRALLRDIPANFFVFQGFLAVFFFLLFLVPIGFAGLTLPLCFHLLRDRKERLGERVGQLYGLNTLGCVFGAIGGGYVLLNYLNLDQLFRVCVLLSVFGVGICAFLSVEKSPKGSGELAGAGALVVLILIAAIAAPEFDKRRFVQPFRHPAPVDPTFQGPAAFGDWLGKSTALIYWKDGPNTTIGIGSSEYQGKELSRTIIVNGKSDGNTRGDFFTTTMLAHIPALLTQKIDRSLVIGFGTGSTIGSLTKYAETKTIDVAEISNFSIATANLFDAYNGGVSHNKKVQFHEMDAFRFLEGTQGRFNLIVSEPSNPWVAGIENLYAGEFYDIALRHLEADGTFVQWIHTYSFRDDLLRMVFKTMSSRFSFVYLFQLKGGDLALVGRQLPFGKAELSVAEIRITEPQVRAELTSAGIKSLDTVLALEIASPEAIRKLAETGGEHSLESPRLSNGAAQAFFEGASARPPYLRRQVKEFFHSLNSSLLAMHLGPGLPALDKLLEMKDTFCDNPASKTPFLCEEVLASMKLLRQTPDTAKYEGWMTTRELASLSTFERPPAKTYDMKELQASYALLETYKRFASPIARIPTAWLLRGVDRCLSTVPRSEELYGECMLQRILVVELATPMGPELRAAVQQYLDWFPSLRKNSQNYAKLDEARNILLRMSATLH